MRHAACTSASPPEPLEIYKIICRNISFAFRVATCVLAILNKMSQLVSEHACPAFLNCVVERNKIIRVTTTATGGYGGRSITIGTGVTGSNVTIRNNVIFGMSGLQRACQTAACVDS